MQNELRIALSIDVLKAYANLPRDRQQAATKFMEKFRSNPTASGLNFERIQSAADPRMRSVRIDQNYRGIVLKPDEGNLYLLLWIDTHDHAYEWARRHRVAVHPELGALQVFDASHEEAEPIATTRPEGSRLFDGLKDRQLARLGVPEELIPAVRSVVDEDGLDGLQSRLPQGAYEALFLHAAGTSYDELILDLEPPETVDTEDFEGALERDSSKQQFVVLTDDSDLAALLAAPLALWRVFLHPTQRKLVERDWNGPVRVLGGAGTGKTVAAMHRAVWLARKHADAAGKPVLFTTFTRTLADDIRSQIAMIATPAELARIEVVNIDSWALSLLRRFGYRHELLFDEGRRRELWARALTRRPDSLDVPDSFYRTEFERVVLPQACMTADDYAKASRVGRGVQLSRAQRRDIWPVFAEYRSQLRGANLREVEEAYHDALSLLKNKAHTPGIRSVVVDETQDLSGAALALLRAAVPEAANDLFLVGDAHQRIYRHKVVLSKVGINIRGRGRRLRINYRTTDEIRRWAAAQLAGCAIDDLEGQPDTLVGYRSLSRGPKPEEILSASREEEQAVILKTLDRLVGSGVEARGICIVLRTNEELDEYASAVARSGRPVLKLTRDTSDTDATPGVRIATMHRVKGLEFDAVIVAGYRGADRYAERFADDGDAGVLVDMKTSERSLLHVAATRAKRFLLVSHIN
ncbi:MAG: UvrD-helicase domain-containing protein [Pseudomonadota bacterium]